PVASAAQLALAVRPNPFTRAGRVEFSVERAGPARLAVLDVAGREVAVLVEGRVPLGRNTVEWNGRDGTGRRLAAGVYFFRLQQDGRARTQKGVLLR
ncbi:MAG: FlgD immunoglobulin-like domain containing protein, partial [bacterium]